ncbi:hypothetical protein [Frigoribacterium endophyticum]|uniref:hypothetical protein n=1 Tax=Frigoribacterium endophyticum TaxID=1522176 RepID=UPI0014228115|nr:hypothetical protein [Frigoribacterium endophyticum]NII52003.1 uncharacterized protein YjbJ (UPF0337 family) [Frigoribacterium endophyticum]
MSDTDHTDGTPSAPLYDQAAGSTSSLGDVTGQGDPFDSVVAGTSAPGTTTTGTGSGSSDSSGSGKADAAKAVAGDAADSAQQVAGTTKEQAGKVASEASGQAKQLFGQATAELKDQAGAQQQKAAEGLHAVSQQLTSMADSSDTGLAQDLVRNLSGRAHGVASWLEGRDPGTLLDDVKHYAARKPGTFIAIAAVSGLFAGRVVKALTAEAKSEHASDASSTGTGTASTTPAGVTSRTAPPTGDATITGPVAGEYDVVTEGDVPGFGTTTSSSTPGTFPGEGATRP